MKKIFFKNEGQFPQPVKVLVEHLTHLAVSGKCPLLRGAGLGFGHAAFMQSAPNDCRAGEGSWWLSLRTILKGLPDPECCVACLLSSGLQDSSPSASAHPVSFPRAFPDEHLLASISGSRIHLLSKQ